VWQAFWQQCRRVSTKSGEWLDQSACADPVVSWVGMRAVLRGHDVSATFHVYCNKLSQGAKRKLK
jgi:hypothetical protein